MVVYAGLSPMAWRWSNIEHALSCKNSVDTSKLSPKVI